MFGGDGSLSLLLYRGRKPLICVLLGFGGGSMAFWPLKDALGSLLPLVPLPPVSAVSPLKVEQFS